MRLIGSLAFILLASPLAANACDFCMLGQGINPYLTAQGRGLTLSQDLIQSDRIYSGSHAIETNGKKEVWQVTSLTGFIALNEDLTLMLTVPYATKSNVDFEEADGSNPGVITNGLGDLLLTGRYTFFKSHALDSTWILGGLLGVKGPSGANNLRDNHGDTADRHAQPGTGSWDESLGLTGSFASANGYQVTADAVYNFAGKGKWGDQEHRYGDSFNASLKGFIRVAQSESKDRSFFIFTGPQFEWTGKEKGMIDDTTTIYDSRLSNPSTGGKVTYWDLGVYGVFSPSVIVNASFAKAIIHDMNYSPDADADPAEDYKTNLSVTFLF